MKLDSPQAQADVVVRYPSCTLDWSKESLNPYQSSYQPSTWVHLLELPSPFSYDEALLLCEHSEDEWVVWIPDHGEAVLNVRQFCPAY